MVESRRFQQFVDNQQQTAFGDVTSSQIQQDQQQDQETYLESGALDVQQFVQNQQQTAFTDVATNSQLQQDQKQPSLESGAQAVQQFVEVQQRTAFSDDTTGRNQQQQELEQMLFGRPVTGSQLQTSYDEQTVQQQAQIQQQSNGRHPQRRGHHW